jgi:hypothetical protein
MDKGVEGAQARAEVEEVVNAVDVNPARCLQVFVELDRGGAVKHDAAVSADGLVVRIVHSHLGRTNVALHGDTLLCEARPDLAEVIKARRREDVAVEALMSVKLGLFRGAQQHVDMPNLRAVSQDLFDQDLAHKARAARNENVLACEELADARFRMWRAIRPLFQRPCRIQDVAPTARVPAPCFSRGRRSILPAHITATTDPDLMTSGIDDGANVAGSTTLYYQTFK